MAQNSVEVGGGSSGAFGIAAFAIVAVVAILGFTLYSGISVLPNFLRNIVVLAIVAGFAAVLMILAGAAGSFKGQSEGSDTPSEIQTRHQPDKLKRELR
jgi:hypothetical protein